jgi:hypothetical protein
MPCPKEKLGGAKASDSDSDSDSAGDIAVDSAIDERRMLDAGDHIVSNHHQQLVTSFVRTTYLLVYLAEHGLLPLHGL